MASLLKEICRSERLEYATDSAFEQAVTWFKYWL